jgi:hypothetical protein
MNWICTLSLQIPQGTIGRRLSQGSDLVSFFIQTVFAFARWLPGRQGVVSPYANVAPYLALGGYGFAEPVDIGIATQRIGWAYGRGFFSKLAGFGLFAGSLFPAYSAFAGYGSPIFGGLPGYGGYGLYGGYGGYSIGLAYSFAMLSFSDPLDLLLLRLVQALPGDDDTATMLSSSKHA